MADLDLIVPVANEAENVAELVKRIDKCLSASSISYRVIFVDDNSTDGTPKIVQKLAKSYPIKLVKKQGLRGKAYSIMEGVAASDAKFLAMIDGDLEYPPEAIPAMYDLVQKHGVVVAKRITSHKSQLRKFVSRAYAFVFGKLVLGLNCDVQSGLKLFRREIIDHISPTDIRAWAIDVPLLHTAMEMGYTIGEVPIEFSPRSGGNSKLKTEFFKAIGQIGGGALRTKLKRPRTFTIPATTADSMVGAGVAHKKGRFITHSTLPQKHSAMITLTAWQKALISTAIGILFISLVLDARSTGIALTAALSSIYFIDVLFSFILVFKSLHFPPELDFPQDDLEKLDPKKLPIYSVLCPLYKEAHVLPHFIESISNLDWPKDKLDVILLLEEDDEKTISAAKDMNLPKFVRTLVVPHSFPKTKPKACNYGLSHAKGEFVVIYDAEDKPEPYQLKKAFVGFRNSSDKTVCLQAKLNYYNPHQNLLTRLFSAEYSLWFDVVLPGLQSVNTTIPLGGTSNHFRTSVLKELHGWDAFNVTEDCDLGSRLFKLGFTTGIIDSVTLEEANSHVGNWIRQRSRWIKGYMQTYFVHTREPLRFLREHGLHALIFHLVIGLRISFMLINPFLWTATISYFALYQFVGPAIEALYPTWVFYMAAISLVFGNFLYIYYYMVGSAKRGHWSVIKYVLLVPIYWLLVSIAAAKAFSQLIFRPHYWEKTHHGLHLNAKQVKQFGFVNIISAFSNIKVKPALLSGAVLVVASISGSFFNFLYNAYLGRSANISVEEFGLISLFGSFVYISQIPITALSKTVTYRTGYLHGKFDGIVKNYWQFIRKQVKLISVVATILWMLFIPILSEFFNSGPLPFILFTPIWILGLLNSVDIGFLSGSHKFILLAIASIAEAISKFAFAVLLVSTGLSSFVYISTPLSFAVAFLITWKVASSIPAENQKIDFKTIKYFPKKFYFTSVLFKLSTIVFLSLDVILARRFLSAEQAGQYAILSLAGKMVYFLGSIFSQFITPIVSRTEGAGKDSKSAFSPFFLATLASSTIGFVVFGLLGRFTAPVLFGDKTFPIIPYLPWYCAGIAAFTVASTVIHYHQTRRQYLFPIIGFLLACIQLVSLSIFHSSLSNYISAFNVLSLSYFVVVIVVHIFYNSIVVVLHNLQDFLGLFVKNPKPKTLPEDKLRILIFNWRDTKHKWAGGAEVYLHEMAKRWVRDGHQVSWFCGNDGSLPRNEKVDGVEVVRRGGFFTVYIWAFLYYIIKFRKNYDFVIDSENGIPFFTPLFVRVPKFLLIHHVHQDLFRSKLYFPMDQIAMTLESQLMPFVYRDQKVITVSESSKADIIKLGLSDESDISIVNPGVDLTLLTPTKNKTKHPSFVYLGRLREQKNVDTILRAFPLVLKEYPSATLSIAGWGDHLPILKEIASSLHIDKNVFFLERISDEDKVKLLSQSWAMIQPSSFEGWGITVIEASACGTAVIASDVSGLRDSVVSGKTGILIPPKDPDAMAGAMLKIISNKTGTIRMAKAGIVWAKNFDWDSNTRRFLGVIKDQLTREYRYVLSRSAYAEVKQ